MAGFSKEDAYYVPRVTLEWENHSLSSLTKHVLPNIDNWKTQSGSRNGDKSQCARTFLYKLLPWFVEVLVQDGIYFITDFPDHPLSAFLRVSCNDRNICDKLYHCPTFSFCTVFSNSCGFQQGTSSGHKIAGESAKV